MSHTMCFGSGQSLEADSVDKIGLYKDELRASWPIVEAPGARENPVKLPC